MADDVLKLLVSVDTKGTPKVKALNKDLKTLDSQSKKTDKSVRGLGSGLSSLVSPLAAVTTGATALYAAFNALKTFAGFDDTMRQVGAVSNATAQELAQLTDLAKTMGAETRFSASQAAEGLKFLGMAGLDVQQQVSALPGVLNLASAGAIDLGTAADIATNILTGYGLQVEELGMVNDILAKTFTNSNTSLQELGYAFTYAGSVAKTSGQDFTETAAALGMLANAGFKGELGGTALRGALLKLQAPTSKGAEALVRLGVAVTDSTGKMRPYLDIIDDLGKAQLTAADRAAIFGVRAGSGVSALILQGSAAIEKMRNTVNDYAGTTDRIAKQMEAGIGGQLRALQSAFEALKISTGEAIANALLDDVQELTTYIRENKDELRGFAVGLAEAVASLAKGSVAVADFTLKNKGLIEAILIVTAGYKAYKIAALAANAATVLLTGTTIAFAALMKATLAGVILYTITQIVKLGVAIYQAVSSYLMLQEANEKAAKSQEKYQKKLDSASKAAGRTISDWREIRKAAANGEIAWDEASQSFVKGSGEQQKAVGDNKEAIAEWEQKLDGLQTKHTQTYDTVQRVTGAALEEMQGKWKELAKKIEEYDDAVEETGRETANVLFELSQKGKAPIESWNAQKEAAGNLSQEIRTLIEEGRQLASAGKLPEAEKSWKKAAELGKELRGVYKTLSREVKAEWTPEMESAHKQASESVKKYADAAKQAMSEAKSHYKSAESTAKSWADKQLDIESRLAEIGRKQVEAAAAATGSTSAMAAAAAKNYNSMVAAAKNYEEKSRKALAAGDTEAALQFAERAMSAWDALGNEVEVDGQKVVSATKALADQAAGTKSAGDAALAALKAKQEAEIAAAQAAEEAAKKAEAARVAEAAKVAELEKQKSAIIKSESEANEEAMRGVAEAGDLITESQKAMADAAREASDELNKQSGYQLGEIYTEAGGQAERLNELQKTHNQLVQDTAIDWGNVWDAMQNGAGDAFDAVDAEIQATEARLDALTRDREVKITIKEVSGASSGASVGIQGASSGASVGRLGRFPVLNGKYGKSLFGYGGGDTLENLFALEKGEQVVNKDSVRKFGGWEFAQAYNQGDEVRVANALFKQFPNLSLNIPEIKPINHGPVAKRETVYKTTIIDQTSGYQFDRYYNNSQGKEMDMAREERFKSIVNMLKK